MRDLSGDTTPWLTAYQQTVTPAYKRVLCWFARPLLDLSVRGHLGPAFRHLPGLTRVLPERGFPLEARRGWLDRHCPLQGKRVLVQGTGTGWDTLSWLPWRPAEVLAIDAFSFERAWRDIGEHVRGRGGRAPRFLVGTLTDAPLASESVDVAGSDAVFEHCTDLAAVMRETHRVLRPGGCVYAGYGPMWFCFGGDHFSGRGGLTHGYSHIELAADGYRRYFETQRLENENAQSGGRYVELDLFSKLTTRQYLDVFAHAGFEVVDLVVEISGQALEFRRTFPARFAAIAASHPEIATEDLLIKANLVILRKRGRRKC